MNEGNVSVRLFFTVLETQNGVNYYKKINIQCPVINYRDLRVDLEFCLNRLVGFFLVPFPPRECEGLDN